MITPIELRDRAVDTLLWTLRLIILVVVFHILWLIVSSITANAAECRSEKGEDSYWQWRYIKPYEHKRCWYKGRRRLPKEDLYWSIMKPEKKMEKPMEDPVFPKKKIIDKLPPKASEPKSVTADEYTELDAQAGKDMFFNAKPMTYWPSVTPFTPWTERVAGALQW